MSPSSRLFFFILLASITTIGGAIASGTIDVSESVQPSLPAFSFTPFPASQSRERDEPPRQSTSTEIVFRDPDTGQTVEHFFVPKPMNIKELAKELGTDEKTVQDAEDWVQEQWDAYRKNPNPALENIKKRLANRVSNLIRNTLHPEMDLTSIGPGSSLKDLLTPQQLLRVRKVVIEDSHTPEFRAEESKLLAFGSIDDTKHPKQTSFDISGPAACVSPNTCYRQGGANNQLGENFFAACCGNGDCLEFFELGCLDLCAGAAIYDYCTGLCGCSTGGLFIE